MPTPDPRHQDRLRFAIEIAREAGVFTLQYFDSDRLEIERKDDDTPVTAADRGAEELLRRRIAEVFPDDGILGEEFPETSGTSGFRWILDPIDGTKSFIHGVPIYATLLGIEEGDQPIAGVNRIPALGQVVYAVRGGGAWYVDDKKGGEAVPARVSTTPRLKESLFLTSEVLSFDEAGRRDAYVELERAARLTRTWGDAYGYLLVATGRADFMVDPVMKSWDAAPMLTILEEAGGAFTDWQGSATIHGGEAVGANRRLLDQILETTRRYPKRPS